MSHRLNLSSSSREAGNKLDGDVGEAVYVLDGKVFSIADKLPFADIIREGSDRFYLKVGKGAYHFHLYISSIVDHLDFAAKEDAVGLDAWERGTIPSVSTRAIRTMRIHLFIRDLLYNYSYSYLYCTTLWQGGQSGTIGLKDMKRNEGL